ncbi:peptidoglycan-N-acetylmuramic acid deacetylase PdaC [Phocicoccus schoeneichii]|uniref:Peptidoglycan-N-acetylmuramic acid deacetylase PdaC n=1 Tax=Phocicoccus schoeneichii TaxID=1812261 RepID=A0A6V7RDA6_9BACL|nr:polysaccharide deacetylase family protein [Jeotgalicoccus schoeneichii]GGH50153.1 peptidoglycan-N-acetylmuramic acid deacetylase PdaC [Jeotgalicoccus schoeneichii]CAD2075545.1 Peptidoglycan-N-acetylmuramic acid deacetylase PdaC [Jeotgalicoccus schoeneichii]
MKKYIFLFSIILAVLTLAACNNEDLANNINNGKSNDSIQHMDTEFSEFKIATYQSKENPLIEIKYPVFKNDDINNKIIRYRDHDITEFIKMVKDDNENNLLIIDIDPKQFNDDVYFFNKTKKARISDSDIFSQHNIFAVNLKSGQVGSTESFFKTDSKTRESLFKILDEAISADGSIFPYYQHHKLEAYVNNMTNGFLNIEFDDDYAIFQFDSEEIGLPAMGTPKVKVLKKDLIPLMDETIQHCITGQKPKPEETDSKETEGSKDNKQAKEYLTIRELDPNQKMVALTFDDGPKSDTTNKLLDKLQAKNVKASFFMLGSSIEAFSDTATRVDREGHEIGNHSYSHQDMMQVSFDEIRAEINDTSALIEMYTNQTPKFFRPPYGSFNATLEAKVNIETSYWSVDTKDWLTHNTDAILKEIKENVQDGSVILLHDIHMESVDAIDDVIDYLTSEGYQFVTVSEMSHYKGENTLKMR